MIHKYFVGGKQVSEMVYYSFMGSLRNTLTRKKMDGCSTFICKDEYSYDGQMRPMVEHRLEVGSYSVYFDVLFDQIAEDVNKDVEDI